MKKKKTVGSFHNLISQSKFIKSVFLLTFLNLKVLHFSVILIKSIKCNWITFRDRKHQQQTRYTGDLALNIL